jgi:lipoprotein-releasing system permease protein
MNKSLFSAINLEKLAMFLIAALITLVAAFNIVSTLVMMVMEKQVDIATLKSIGATSASIMKIFMLEGFVIGILGTMVGALVGIAGCWAADTFKWIQLDAGSYFLQHLPFTVTPGDVLLVIGASLLICFLSTIHPARQASKLDPVAVFRYE